MVKGVKSNCGNCVQWLVGEGWCLRKVRPSAGRSSARRLLGGDIGNAFDNLDKYF